MDTTIVKLVQMPGGNWFFVDKKGSIVLLHNTAARYFPTRNAAIAAALDYRLVVTDHNNVISQR